MKMEYHVIGCVCFWCFVTAHLRIELLSNLIRKKKLIFFGSFFYQVSLGGMDTLSGPQLCQIVFVSLLKRVLLLSF